MALEERERVPDVLLVQLRDLELRQQQLGERDRDRIDLEPGVERDLVRHGEGAYEDVDLPVVVDVEEEEPLLPVQGVEGDVRLVTLVPEELGRPARPLPRRDEVEVRVRAPECRQQVARRAEPDCHAAQESQWHVGLRCTCEQSLTLGDDVGLDHHAVRASSASPCRR